MISSTIGPRGEVDLPDDVRERYGLLPDTPIRIIETRTGILIVPITDAPISHELETELAEWQWLSSNTWELFPYEDDDK